MDFLKQSLAPISSQAWEFLENEARTVLTSQMTGRRVVDVSEPRGFDFSSVNLGKLGEIQRGSQKGLRYALRRVLPLVEVRVDFTLDIWQLDDLARGAPAADTQPLIEACTALAQLENESIFDGCAPAGVVGIRQAAKHDPISLGSDPLTYPDAIARGVLTLQEAGVGGPYALVLGTEEYRALFATPAPYPIHRRVRELVNGSVLHCASSEGGVLVSTRGGDLDLTIGLDASLGYEKHDEKTVQLFLTETFAFRVIGDDAALAFTTSQK